MTSLSTGQVAELLKINSHRLEYLTRDRQVRPMKGFVGAFHWSFLDVCQAARLLKIEPPTEEAFQQAAAGTHQR